MSSAAEPPYALPKRQFINSTFNNRAASSTGEPPRDNPNVVSGKLQNLASEKYFEIKVVLHQNTYYIYQNVQTGGFIYVESTRPGTNVTESTTATLWVKHMGAQFVKLSPAKDHDREDVYIQLRRDIEQEPLVLSNGDDAGTQWSILEVN
ncbi:hypothetical protein BC629DRAFT_1588291 [Irpex lacteus]|nr:hypothetical protein BC629DRAFT_1588291 [Irpex lacteus]